jgi:hypothetical protein
MMQPSTLASDGPVRAKSLHMSDTYSLLRSAGFRRYNRQTNLLSTCERAEATILLALRTMIAHVFWNAQGRAAGAAPHSTPRFIGESPAEFSMAAFSSKGRPCAERGTLDGPAGGIAGSSAAGWPRHLPRSAEKVYYPKGQPAARADGRDPGREMYRRRPRKGNGRFEAWRQLAGK